MFRFSRKIDQLRHRGLHPESEFILRDASQRFGIPLLLLMKIVEGCQIIELLQPNFTSHARRIGEKQHRIAARAELHSLMW